MLDNFLIRDKKVIWYFIFAISVWISVTQFFHETYYLQDVFVVLLGIAIVKIINFHKKKRYNKEL